MEVLYHIKPYLAGNFPHIALAQAWYIVGTSNLGSWNGHWYLFKYYMRTHEPIKIGELRRFLFG